MAPTKGGRGTRSQPEVTSPRASDEDGGIVVDTPTGAPGYQDDEVVQLANDMQKSVHKPTPTTASPIDLV